MSMQRTASGERDAQQRDAEEVRLTGDGTMGLQRELKL